MPVRSRGRRITVIGLHREKSGGTGRAVVILHGLFGSLANWRSVARALSDRFTVYSVDLRNHGRSPWDPVHTYSAMTCDVAGVLDDAGHFEGARDRVIRWAARSR